MNVELQGKRNNANHNNQINRSSDKSFFDNHKYANSEKLKIHRKQYFNKI